VAIGKSGVRWPYLRTDACEARRFTLKARQARFGYWFQLLSDGFGVSPCKSVGSDFYKIPISVPPHPSRKTMRAMAIKSRRKMANPIFGPVDVCQGIAWEARYD
jgi:hypothetical protein